jgi:hypothetical protein
VLVEVKYNRELNEKQELLFRSFAAAHKLTIQNRNEIEELERYLPKEPALLKFIS